MEKRPFGRTGLHVSTLGFGGAPVGYLNTEQERIERILNLLLDRGVNVIDTAECYPGSEEAIGKAISHRRGEFVLITKCGHQAGEATGADWSPKLVSASVDQSLRRLKTDRLDVVLLHSCDMTVLNHGELLAVLTHARDAGKIRFIGYSGDNEVAAHAATMPDISVIETSVSICDQANIDSVLPVAQQRNCGVIAKRPVANAAWKPMDQISDFYRSYAKPYVERFQAMGLTAEMLGFSGSEAWPEIALRFTLSQPGVSTAIVGTTRVESTEKNLAAIGRGPLPEDAIRKIRNAFRRAEERAGTRWEGLT